MANQAHHTEPTRPHEPALAAVEIPGRSVLLPRSGDLRTELTAVLHALRTEGSVCGIVAPSGNARIYVQCIVTPVGIHLEAVSNIFLAGTSHVLNPAQGRRLVELGWNPPEVPEDPAERDSDWTTRSDLAFNWWKDLGGEGDLQRSADLLLTTLVTVYRTGTEALLEVETLWADCQEWVYADGTLEALDC